MLNNPQSDTSVNTPVYYTLKQVAKILHVSEMTVRRRIDNGKLEAYKPDGKILITPKQIKKYVEGEKSDVQRTRELIDQL